MTWCPFADALVRPWGILPACILALGELDRWCLGPPELSFSPCCCLHSRSSCKIKLGFLADQAGERLEECRTETPAIRHACDYAKLAVVMLFHSFYNRSITLIMSDAGPLLLAYL